MSKADYTPEDFAELAYEFAIRNPRVIELFNQRYKGSLKISFKDESKREYTSLLTEEVAKELLEKFGIDTKIYKIDSEGNKHFLYYGTEELCLNYSGLKKVEWKEYYAYDKENIFLCKKLRKIIQPKPDSLLMSLESENIAIKRISYLIESRGRKLERLMRGMAFEHYDKVNFEEKTIYSLDTTTNTKKTITTDIAFIKEWINPEKYLQLIPKYIFPPLLIC